MDADFPAAHSMDTHWFAVDADGHVGRFSSGESGAVPVNAAIDEPARVDDRLAAILPRCEVLFDLQGHLNAGSQGDDDRHWFRDSGSEYGALVFLASLDPVRE